MAKTNATLATRATTRSAKPKVAAGTSLKQAQRAAMLLKMIGDPTRLHIVLMLSVGEHHVGELRETLNQSQPATSHHLSLLRHGSIIAPRRQGQKNYYALTGAGERLVSIVKTVLD
jgi:DNA-binding transcriptional ArsR family regulator